MDTLSLLLLIQSAIHQNPLMGIIFGGIILLVLLITTGLISAFQAAYTSLTSADFADLKIETNRSHRRLLRLHDDHQHTLVTIHVANLFMKVLIVVLSSLFVAHTLPLQTHHYVLQLLLLTVTLTALLLLFGEVFPHLIGKKHALGFCSRYANLILFLSKICWVFDHFYLRFGCKLPQSVQKQNLVKSVLDLEHALEMTDQEDIQSEQRMLQGIMRFGDETAKEVMTGRKDIVAIDIRTSYQDVLSSVIQNNYSRIPVYKDNDDNIRGILYSKDLLPYLNKPTTFRWQSLIRPPYFVPETKKIDDLLSEFKQNKVHMAIVVDEFGGTSGLVTLEDILEEIVGEINDEFDEEEQTYSKLDNNTYLFEGKTLLSDFCKIMNISAEEFEDVEGDADTLAGLLLEIKKDFLEVHEVITYKHYAFEILQIEERRISRIKLTVIPQNTEID